MQPPEEKRCGHPAVTVVVTTYDSSRWPLLERCLQALEAQTAAPASIVTVVDGNEELLTRLRATHPHVTAIANDAFPGAGGARSAALPRVRTDVVAFLDDDAEATPTWLHEHVAAYDDQATVGTAGRLVPRWEEGRPTWFPPEFDWVVGCTYDGMPVRDGTLRNPISANMTVRTEALRAVGGFRANFGKVGTVSLPEDTDLGIRILAAFPGSHWRYRPTAVAHHHVPPERARVGYFVRRCWYEGIGKARLATHVGAPDALASEREYTRRALPRAVARSMRRFAAHRDVGALAEAGAVVAGLAVTAAGYVTAAAGERASLRRLSVARRGRSRR